jgi:uncharacterized protein (TIGR03435 family)
MRTAAIVSALALAPAVRAQAPVTPPAFEVATIKRSAALDAGGTAGFQPGGRFRAVNIDGRSLILSAYKPDAAGQRLLVSQLVGAPGWLAVERYDITARVGDDLAARTTTELFLTLSALLQSLLEDRFKLKTHHETRDLPLYALTLARKDGALGPQLTRSSSDCVRDRDRCRMDVAAGHLRAGGVSLATLTLLLSGPLQSVVVDRTGLAGAVDIELDWSPDQSASDKPSIFAAVQEQLGLKLESTRGPVDVLVIDHVERPTED